MLKIILQNIPKLIRHSFPNIPPLYDLTNPTAKKSGQSTDCPNIKCVKKNVFFYTIFFTHLMFGQSVDCPDFSGGRTIKCMRSVIIVWSIWTFWWILWRIMFGTCELFEWIVWQGEEGLKTSEGISTNCWCIWDVVWCMIPWEGPTKARMCCMFFSLISDFSLSGGCFPILLILFYKKIHKHIWLLININWIWW